MVLRGLKSAKSDNSDMPNFSLESARPCSREKVGLEEWLSRVVFLFLFSHVIQFRAIKHHRILPRVTAIK